MARTRQVALLRGINVGKARRIGMADLRAWMEDLGYADVATHLRSGNVVYTSPHGATAAARRIAAGIADRAGFPVDVLVRTAAQVDAILERDPLGEVATDGARYLVVFLDRALPAATRRKVEDVELGGERVAVHGKEVYLWCPDGVHRSRAWKPLARPGAEVVATARNWNTVTRLAAMLAG